MRSLERPGLHAAFKPLDPNERLPRELLVERREGFTWGLRLGRQHIAGVLWLPVWLATLAGIIWIGGSVTLALVAAGLLFLIFAAFAFSNPRN
jgi:hypothetical protein